MSTNSRTNSHFSNLQISVKDLLTHGFSASPRHQTHEVSIGSIKIGGNNPIAIQSMTDTVTADVESTAKQIRALVDAGSDLVRLTINDDAAALALPQIKRNLVDDGYAVPLIGDFHYNGHILLSKFPECAASLDKYRINPGNVGTDHKRDSNFEAILRIAMENKKPIRIGVNWGSLDKHVLQEAMDENRNLITPRSHREVVISAVVASALHSAKLAEEYGMPPDKIVLSAKMSHVRDVVDAYNLLAMNCDYALHIGLTEAGMGDKGVIASSVAIAHLLINGIGDTIRSSLTPRPGGHRANEVEVCKLLLQSLGLRKFKPMVTSCPGCGRTSSSAFQKLALQIDEYLQLRMIEWKKLGVPGVEDLEIAVMGCVVNGPGESKYANIGISLPGSQEDPHAPVYVDGKLVGILQGTSIPEEFMMIVDAYIARRIR